MGNPTYRQGLGTIYDFTATGSTEKFTLRTDLHQGMRLIVHHEISGSPATGGYVKAYQRPVTLTDYPTRIIAEAPNSSTIAASPNGLVLSSGTLTITTAAAHNAKVGDLISIRNSISSTGTLDFNALVEGYRVVTVADTTHLTFGLVAVDDTGGGGTIYITPEIPHHGAGYNIPSGYQTTSYICVFDYVSPYVNLDLIATDGRHRIWSYLVAG